MFSRAESADLSRVFGVKSSSFAWAGEALRKKVFAAEGRGIAQNRVRVAVRRTLVLSARAEGGWFPCPLPAGGVQDASHAPGVLRDRALAPPPSPSQRTLGLPSISPLLAPYSFSPQGLCTRCILCSEMPSLSSVICSISSVTSIGKPGRSPVCVGFPYFQLVDTPCILVDILIKRQF